MDEVIAIDDILDDQLIDLHLSAQNKDEVIHKLATKMSDRGLLKDVNGFIDDVYLREAEGITGMGNGVAIPHGKSVEVKSACIAIGRIDTPIAWESYDDQPVRLFFLFAVPNDKNGSITHLKLLSQIAGKLADEETLESLKQVKTVEEFKKYFN